VNRRLIPVALLAIVLAACGTNQADETDATTQEPTPAPTSEAPAPTDEAATSDDGGGAAGSLADMIPDELNGVAATEIPGMEAIISGALQQQGLDGGEAEFAFVTYGEGADAIVLNAFRLPGVDEQAMEQLARIMSGAGGAGELEAETTEVGGKTVLSFSGGGANDVVYFYVVDDVAFTIAGQEASSVEQLLSQLP
jgi:hypothetical protein